MKWVIGFLACSLFVNAPARAQSRPDTLATKGERHPRHLFVDENGDGVPDRTGPAGTSKRGRTDTFIDANGDGICDSREQGLGFQWNGSGNGQQRGRKGQGGRK